MDEGTPPSNNSGTNNNQGRGTTSLKQAAAVTRSSTRGTSGERRQQHQSHDRRRRSNNNSAAGSVPCQQDALRRLASHKTAAFVFPSGSSRRVPDLSVATSSSSVASGSLTTSTSAANVRSPVAAFASASPSAAGSTERAESAGTRSIEVVSKLRWMLILCFRCLDKLSHVQRFLSYASAATTTCLSIRYIISTACPTFTNEFP